MIPKADKGQVTVIMNKKRYYDSMLQLLNDKSTYNGPIKDLINRIRN